MMKRFLVLLSRQLKCIGHSVYTMVVVKNIPQQIKSTETLLHHITAHHGDLKLFFFGGFNMTPYKMLPSSGLTEKF